MVGAVSQDTVIGDALLIPAIIGKLPAHGDFIARGIEFGLREKLDLWMSQWIEQARAELGEDFETVYCSAAPWIFEGTRCRAVLIPSADAVGRLFPLLAIANVDASSQLIYDTLIETLASGHSGDELVTRLAALECVDADAGTNQAGWFLPEGAEPTLPSPDAVEGWAGVEVCFV